MNTNTSTKEKFSFLLQLSNDHTIKFKEPACKNIIKKLLRNSNFKNVRIVDEANNLDNVIFITLENNEQKPVYYKDDFDFDSKSVSFALLDKLIEQSNLSEKELFICFNDKHGVLLSLNNYFEVMEYDKFISNEEVLNDIEKDLTLIIEQNKINSIKSKIDHSLDTLNKDQFIKYSNELLKELQKA